MFFFKGFNLKVYHTVEKHVVVKSCLNITASLNLVLTQTA